MNEQNDLQPVSPGICEIARTQPYLIAEINQGLLRGVREMKRPEILRSEQLDALIDLYEGVGWCVNVVESSHRGLHLIFSVPAPPPPVFMVEVFNEETRAWVDILGPFDSSDTAWTAVHPLLHDGTQARVVAKERS